MNQSDKTYSISSLARETPFHRKSWSRFLRSDDGAKYIVITNESNTSFKFKINISIPKLIEQIEIFMKKSRSIRAKKAVQARERLRREGRL